MIEQARKILYDSVHQFNILPLTSACNVSCIFCSHRQNPDNVEVYTIPPLILNEIEELMLFLSAKRKIVIGESATRLIEGEPFTHPDFLRVLKILRQRFPQTQLQITTNGSLITEAAAAELKQAGSLEINLSLNSSSASVRSFLMRDRNAQAAIEGVRILSKAGLPFHGSIVAMPWLTGWEDIKSTIDFLAQAGSITIRVFIPGFTRFGEEFARLPVNWEQELRNFLDICRNQINVPLSVEPPLLHDLRAEISGIIQGSIGQLAGLKRGMEILAINGVVPFSRADAFNSLNKAGHYIIRIKEHEKERNIKLNLKKGQKSGLVMDCDLSEHTAQMIIKSINSKGARNPMILAAKAGVPLIEEALKKLGFAQRKDTVVCTLNHYFGGNISAAGLLVVDDFICTIKNEIANGKRPDLFILPASAFDTRGRDLLGVSYEKIVENFAAEVELV